MADDRSLRSARATEPIHRLGCVGMEPGAQGGHKVGPSYDYGFTYSGQPYNDGCSLSWYSRGGWSGVADDRPQRKARATEPIHRLGCVGLELGAQGGHKAGPSFYYGFPLLW